MYKRAGGASAAAEGEQSAGKEEGEQSAGKEEVKPAVEPQLEKVFAQIISDKLCFRQSFILSKSFKKCFR